MTVYTASNSSSFNAAINKANGGDTIKVSGNVGSVTISKSFSANVKIEGGSTCSPK